MIKKYLSLHVSGLYIFKYLTRIRLCYQKIFRSKSSIFFYYTQTKALIEQELNATSIAIDVGASKGDILDIILDKSPLGAHIAIEPIPIFYNFLNRYYRSKKIEFFNAVALDRIAKVPFYFQTNQPAISGYSKVNKQLDKAQELTLETVTVDSITSNMKVYDLIKIDCIGSELLVIKGAVSTLKRDKPLLIFDFIGAHFKEHDANKLYTTLSDIGYRIYLLDNYPKANPLSITEFNNSVFKDEKSHFYASHKLTNFHK